MELVNLTKKPIKIVNGQDSITIPHSGSVARCAESMTELAPVMTDMGTVRATIKMLGTVSCLPEPREGVLYITSFLVAQHVWKEGRTDVVTLNQIIRDAGQAIGCRSLSFNPSLRRNREVKNDEGTEIKGSSGETTESDEEGLGDES